MNRRIEFVGHETRIYVLMLRIGLTFQIVIVRPCLTAHQIMAILYSVEYLNVVGHKFHSTLYC